VLGHRDSPCVARPHLRTRSRRDWDPRRMWCPRRSSAAAGRRQDTASSRTGPNQAYAATRRTMLQGVVERRWWPRGSRDARRRPWALQWAPMRSADSASTADAFNRNRAAAPCVRREVEVDPHAVASAGRRTAALDALTAIVLTKQKVEEGEGGIRARRARHPSKRPNNNDARGREPDPERRNCTEFAARRGCEGASYRAICRSCRPATSVLNYQLSNTKAQFRAERRPTCIRADKSRLGYFPHQNDSDNCHRFVDLREELPPRSSVHCRQFLNSPVHAARKSVTNNPRLRWGCENGIGAVAGARLIPQIVRSKTRSVPSVDPHSSSNYMWQPHRHASRVRT